MPGRNWWNDAYALAKVSWTRSSASAGLRVIRIAARVELVEEGQRVALEAGGALGRRSRWRRRPRRARRRRGRLGVVSHRLPAYCGSAGRSSQRRARTGHVTRRTAIPAVRRSARFPATSRTIHSRVASTTTRHRLVLADAAPRAGHLEPVVGRRARRQVDVRRGTPRAGPSGRARPGPPASARRRPRSSSSRDFSGRPGGCSGNDRARQPAAPRRVAHAGRRAGARPSGRRPPAACARRSASAAATQRRRRGWPAGWRPCGRPPATAARSSTTVMPWRGQRRGQRLEVAGVDAAAGAVAEQQRGDRAAARGR